MLTPEELPHYVYEDYAQWEGRWELIEGIPYAMTPAPDFRHWRVTEDTIVQPDNMVLCDRPSGVFLSEAPTLIFEVLSPSTARKDKRTKYAIYEREGVAYYCIVDPENRAAEIYRLVDGGYVKQVDAAEQAFVFDLGKCRIEFDFARIWVE